MTYPLAALEGIRERERDAAAQTLAGALAALEQRLADEAQRARAHQDALSAWHEERGHPAGPCSGVDLQLRAAYRERLAAALDASVAALAQARAEVARAEAVVDDARRALAEARAQHRAVSLHHEAHDAQQRALAEAREAEALDEAASFRTRA